MPTETLSKLAESVSVTVKDGANKLWDKQDEWQQNANGYRLTLRYKGRRMSLDFWQGTGIKEKPTAEGVLGCLMSDASLCSEGFDEFCANCGYDTDSRKALASFKDCERQTERVKRLLGEDYETFLYAERV